jgi:hypothetical protein
MTKLLSVGGGGGGTTSELLGSPDELGGGGTHQLLEELPIHHELLGHQTLPLLGG